MNKDSFNLSSNGAGRSSRCMEERVATPLRMFHSAGVKAGKTKRGKVNDNIDILLIGGSADDVCDRPVSRIEDSWAGLQKGPDGRDFYDFKHYVIWPTPALFEIPKTQKDYLAASKDLNIAPLKVPDGYFQPQRKSTTTQKKALKVFKAGPSEIEQFRQARISDCSSVMPRLASNIVAGGIIILVVPERLADMPIEYRAVLNWLSRSLTCVRSDDRVVEKAPDNLPADMTGTLRRTTDRITALYAKITTSVRDWPPLAFNMTGGYPECSLQGLHVWGEHFSQNAVSYTPDDTYGVFIDRLKDTSVLTLPGHMNMQRGDKSLLFVSGNGGAIVIPEIVKLPDLLDILLAVDDGQDHCESDPVQPPSQTAAPPQIRLELMGESKGKVIRGHGAGWSVKCDGKDVVLTHETFLILLAHIVSAKVGDPGINPQKPKIKNTSIETQYPPHKPSKPAQQIHYAFRSQLPGVTVLESARWKAGVPGPRLYTLAIPVENVSLEGIKASANSDVKALLMFLKKPV